MPYHVYLIQNEAGQNYIGQTKDLTLRLMRHNEGHSFWTKSRGPWRLVHSKEFSSRSEAMMAERELKAIKNRRALQQYLAQW